MISRFINTNNMISMLNRRLCINNPVFKQFNFPQS